MMDMLWAKQFFHETNFKMNLKRYWPEPLSGGRVGKFADTWVSRLARGEKFACNNIQKVLKIPWGQLHGPVEAGVAVTRAWSYPII